MESGNKMELDVLADVIEEKVNFVHFAYWYYLEMFPFLSPYCEVLFIRKPVD
jgi:hypothetical protein